MKIFSCEWHILVHVKQSGAWYNLKFDVNAVTGVLSLKEVFFLVIEEGPIVFHILLMLATVEFGTAYICRNLTDLL
jgi:hypothetical protein